MLYFDGCPHYEAFLPYLHDLLHTHGITAEVTLIRIDNDDDAQTHHFLGSPTVRINGHDIDPDAADHQHNEAQDPSTSPYGMQCRLYRTPSGTTGIPSDQWILDALDHQAHEDITSHATTDHQGPKCSVTPGPPTVDRLRGEAVLIMGECPSPAQRGRFTGRW